MVQGWVGVHIYVNEGDVRGVDANCAYLCARQERNVAHYKVHYCTVRGLSAAALRTVTRLSPTSRCGSRRCILTNTHADCTTTRTHTYTQGAAPTGGHHNNTRALCQVRQQGKRHINCADRVGGDRGGVGLGGVRFQARGASVVHLSVSMVFG